MKILHVINDLDRGGAENALVKLVGELPGLRHRIVSLLPEGPLTQRARTAGAEIVCLNMQRRLPGPGQFVALVRAIRAFAPDVVQTWLYHSDLLGLAAARMAGCPPVAWNLRCSDMDFSFYRLGTKLVVRLLALFSTAPEAIVSNSRAAVALHQGLGYAKREFTVIPNGFDLEHFRPDAGARTAVRQECAIPDGAPVVGMVARLDPMKDHATFFAAAEVVGKAFPLAHFVLCGTGVEPGDADLARQIRGAGLEGRVHLLGPRDDVPRIMAALDCHVLSSAFGEGFPNALGEAMAAGVPCVSTDVGDAAMIVGDTGRIVPRRDAAALGRAVAEILALPGEARAALGRRARERVEREFSLQAMGQNYLRLWESLAAGAGRST